MMGCVLSAGGSFQWYRNQFGQSEVAASAAMGLDPYELLTAQAAQAPPGSEGLFFLPYLTGERTPHADPDARGAWVGMSLRHGKSHFARSVMEGATFAMRDCLELIRKMEIPVEQIRLSGGGARSQFWKQLQADIYGQQVVTINAEEGPAFGVALLAAARNRGVSGRGRSLQGDNSGRDGNRGAGRCEGHIRSRVSDLSAVVSVAESGLQNNCPLCRKRQIAITVSKTTNNERAIEDDQERTHVIDDEVDRDRQRVLTPIHCYRLSWRNDPIIMMSLSKTC